MGWREGGSGFKLAFSEGLRENVAYTLIGKSAATHVLLLGGRYLQWPHRGERQRSVLRSVNDPQKKATAKRYYKSTCDYKFSKIDPPLAQSDIFI